MLKKIHHLALVGAFLVVANCSTHMVKHSAPDETRPHVSWEIRSGQTDSDDALVCGSAKPDTSCVLEAGSQVSVHFAFHAVKDQTLYTGQVRVPFIESIGQGGTRDIRVDVPPGTASINTSVTGLVIRQPGPYTLAAAIDAQQNGKPAGHLSADVRVVVR